MIIKIILKLCSIFGSSGSANQSLGNLPARQSIFATSLLITLCGSPHAAVDPASGWNITWSSTVTGGGEEDIGEFHSESSISGQLSGGYLLAGR